MERQRSRSPRRSQNNIWRSAAGSGLGEVIQLNVGGRRYLSTRSTLSQATYFERLLQMTVNIDESGSVFIDRDGETFGGILAWLRTQKVWHSERPNDEEKLRLRRLRCEAEFFGVDGLVDAVNVALSVVTEQTVLIAPLHNYEGGLCEERPAKVHRELQKGWRIKHVALAAIPESEDTSAGLYGAFSLER